MPRFIAKPLYTIGELAQILNSYEVQEHGRDRHGQQRTLWNRDKVRRLLAKFGVIPRSNGPRSKGIVSFTQLREMAPEVVDSMLTLDALEEAQAA